MNFKSLQARIIFAFAIVIIIGFGGLAFLSGNQLQLTTTEDFTQRTEERAETLGQALAKPLEESLDGDISPSVLEGLINEYRQQPPGSEIVLLSTRGEVLAGGTRLMPAGDMMTQSTVQSALNGDINSEVMTVADDTSRLVTAAPVIYEGQTLAVVWLAVPRAEVESTILQRWQDLIIGVGILTIITVVVSVILAISVTRPLKQLRQSAMHLAEGDFSQPLPETRQDEIGELARTFNYMREQVQAMLEEQRAFASNAAHELRTPLTTILLRTEALLDDLSHPTQTEQYVDEIHDEISRLAGLIDDLFLLSRLDANRFEPGREQIDMERFTAQLKRQFEPRFASKSQQFEVEVVTPLSPMETSLNHLHVVFRNLLENAHKYTPESGQIKWRVWQDGDRLVSTVTDTGSGISAEAQDKLFRRFYRGDRSHSRTISGTGLGLALCRLIVEAYGGKLTIFSEGVDKGTVATVSWPLEVTEHVNDKVAIR